MSVPSNSCDVHGDLRPYKPGVSVDVAVDGHIRSIRVCDFHQAFFEDAAPDTYLLTLSMNDEVVIILDI